MTLEELKVIREKLDKVFATPDEEDLCLICTSMMHFGLGRDRTPTCCACTQEMVKDDMPKLLNEVERLQKQLQPPCLMEGWLPNLANQCAYQIHRVIGNNIEHYRGQTAQELMSLIEAAVGRNTGI